MIDTSRPIGIFDSGIGGLTVANAISDLLPDEQLIYFGDTAHFPYGEKSPSALRDYSLAIAQYLSSRGCKLIVVACNSAWSSAHAILSKEFDNIINVVDPVIKLIGKKNYDRIALIATRATIRNGIFSRRIIRMFPGIEVVSRATPILVHIIEEGLVNDSIGEAVIRKHFDKHTFGDISALVLACTHFSIIKDTIKRYLGPGVEIIDSNVVVAEQVASVLKRNGELSGKRQQENEFYFSDLTDITLQISQEVYNGDIHPKLKNIWV